MHNCNELTARWEASERQLDDEAEKFRLRKVPPNFSLYSTLGLCRSSIVSSMQGECDSLAFSKQELEKALSEQTSHTDELERQLNEQAVRCQILEVHNLNTTLHRTSLVYLSILCMVYAILLIIEA